MFNSSFDNQLGQVIESLEKLRHDAFYRSGSDSENGDANSRVIELERQVAQLSLENERMSAHIEYLEDKISSYIEKSLENITPSRVVVVMKKFFHCVERYSRWNCIRIKQ